MMIMIYSALVLTLLILVLRSVSPKRYAVHAAQAVELLKGMQPEDRWTLGGLLRDQTGTRIDLSEKFIGRAVRDSMARFGIPSGSTFIGEYLTDSEKNNLVRGNIVVVDGPALHSETGLRLRCIDSIVEGTARFSADGYGQSRRQRPLSEIFAIVTHVVDESDVRY
jgi:hypothetical protein